MCGVNENNCKCNAKEICCKMQKDSLRVAILGLKSNQDCRNTIRRILDATYSVLDVYKCLPGSCLLDRVHWVYKNIGTGCDRLYKSEQVKVNMLIAELDAFLNS